MARSLLFNLLFYVTTTLFVVLGSPLLFAPRRWTMVALAVHSRFELWLLKLIVGTKLEGRGGGARPGARSSSPRNTGMSNSSCLPIQMIRRGIRAVRMGGCAYRWPSI